MEQTLNYEMYLLDAQTMVNQGYDNVSVEKQLKHKGADEFIISGIMKEIKRLRNAKRTKTGSLLALTGVLFFGAGFLSCIIIHINGGDIGFALYGLTAIGAVILTTGLIFIFS